MLARWVRTYQHLLPRARAWTITTTKPLRAFFEGLANTPNDVEAFIDRIFFDLYPQTTRQVPSWEQQFNLDGNGTTQERRDRIAAAWRRTGGQDPRYIQDQLQAAGFDVYVHDWFAGRDLVYSAECGQVDAESGAAIAECGTIADPSGQPVVRNPNVYIVDEGSAVFTVQTGEADSQTGVSTAVTGGRSDDRGYPLINRTGAGDYTFPISTDPTTFSSYWYVGGSIFPNKAQVSAGRKREFERLLLSLGPAHLWIGVLVEYI